MKIKIFIILCLSFLLTGCWNYSELNELSIVTGFAIDKVGQKYNVSLLIANSQKTESTTKEGEAKTTVYSGKGNTISDAIKQIELKNPKKLYIGHVTVLIVSKQIAKEGIANVGDFLIRNPESRKKFYFLISRDKAENVLTVLSPLESFPSQNIASMVKSSNEVIALANSTLYNMFIETLLKPGINPVAETIEVQGNADEGKTSKNLESSKPNTNLKLNTLGIFKKDKLTYIANEKESQGITIINNNSQFIDVTFKCNRGEMTVNITNTKAKIKMINNRLFNILVKGTSEIKETTCNINLTKNSSINIIQRKSNQELKSILISSIKKMQKIKSDVFGFGNIIYKENYNQWKKINNWDDEFSKIKVNIKTNITITKRGSSQQSLKEKL